MEKLFTVIMPNYNNGQYIAAAIDSVLQQSYPNWELIIVDDGSTDNSVEVILEYVNKYSQIYFVKNRRNKGISYSMNRGCKLAKGCLVGTLDSDDILERNALEYMMNLHEENPDYSLIVSTISLNDQNMKYIGIEDSLPLLKEGETLFEKRGETVQVYLNERKIKFISMSFRVFKREAFHKIKGYDTSLNTAEDVDIMYQLEKVGKVMFTEEPIYKRRVIGTSITNNVLSISLYCDFIRAECKEIKRRYHRWIPFCNFNHIPSLAILYFNLWYRKYRPGSDILLADMFIKAGYSCRKKSKQISSLYMKIGNNLRKADRGQYGRVGIFGSKVD